MNSAELRNKCQNLYIGEGLNASPIWTKQLKRILNTDIHKRELGCRCSTHIKIGSVHLDAFYEARILFSHNIWINRFAEWLLTQIGKRKKVAIVGYETDVETILFLLQQKYEDAGLGKLRYGIYEEKKYTQNNGYAQTKENIRYLDGLTSLIDDDDNPDDCQVVFLCGTSSTLSTFQKMKGQLGIDTRASDGNVWNALLERASYFSIIQVLPSNLSGQSIFKDGTVDSFNTLEKYAQRAFDNPIYVKKDEIKEAVRNAEKPIIKSTYLVDVYCRWYDAHTCELCYPMNPLDERPIIATSETSVVPFQMIQLEDECKRKNDGDLIKKIDGDALLWDVNGYKYVYYDHIDRMDHHFKYYVRTAHLIKEILDEKGEKWKLFKQRCEEISSAISDKECVDIIVFPSNYGDEVFPLAINEYVFENRAYILSLNPNKEFRSNFETKYSNIEYILEQVKTSERNVKIRFHYVAKQLLSVENYSRIKSLIRSLMKKHNSIDEGKENIELFSSTIIFLSRISKSTIEDYIKSERFFSFIDVKIPSLRNYGDSCPICKRRQEVADYVKASKLDLCAHHWLLKYTLYEPKSIEKAIDFWKKQDNEKKKIKYNRFYCENRIWDRCLNEKCFSKEEYVKAFFNTMGPIVMAEDFISYVKAISGPFLYYKEGEKEAALEIILTAIERLCEAKTVGTVKIVCCGNDLKIKYGSRYEQYTTLVVMLNCLAGMDSTYILEPDRIVKLCNFVGQISKKANNEELDMKKLLSFDNSDNISTSRKRVDPFYSCIVYAFKRTICGISGDAKSKRFDCFFADDSNRIKEIVEKHPELETLFDVLFLENDTESIDNAWEAEIENSLEKESIGAYANILEALSEMDICESDDMPRYKRENTDIMEKYGHIIAKLSEAKHNARVFFAYYDESFEEKYYPICRRENNGQVVSSFWNAFETKYKTLIESDNLKNCGWSCDADKNLFLVSLKDYSLTNSIKTDMDISANARMYLIIDFAETCIGSEYEKMRVVRDILKYRYSLCEIIASDIANNSIKEAIQAREAEKLLSQNKMITHNGDKDIYWMLKKISDIADRWDGAFIEKNIDAAFLFDELLEFISLLVGYCIGRAASEFLLRSYYGENTIQNSVIANSCNHFINTHLALKGVTSDKSDSQGLIISNYLDCLNRNGQETLNYFKELKIGKVEIKRMGWEDDKIEKTVVSSKEIVEEIKKTNALPCFVQANSMEKMSVRGDIFLIGILDLFLKDVSKHAGKSDVKIVFSSSKIEHSYRIQVRNLIPKKLDTKQQGVTRWFYSLINDRAHRDGANWFCIKREKQGNEFVSEILVHGF